MWQSTVRGRAVPQACAAHPGFVARDRLATLLAVVFVAGWTLTVTGCHGDKTQAQSLSAGDSPRRLAMKVQVAPISRGSITTDLELTGNILPLRRTLIVSQVDGVIQSIPASGRKIEAEIDGRRYSEMLSLNLGHEVNEGDVLVVLDPTEYELQLAAAKARLEQANKQLEDLLAWRRPETVRRAAAMRAEAAARLERAKTEFERVQTLVNQRAGAQQEYDHAMAELKFAEAGLERAEAEYQEVTAGPTESQVGIARAQVAQAAAEVAIHQDRLNRTIIRAPYSGIITERYVYEGERLTMMPRVELMELIDVSLLLVQVSVPERYLGLVQLGDWVRVQAAGRDQAVPGMIVLVNEKVDYETRSFRVRVAIENHERRLKAGQFAKVAFPISAASDTLLIPAAAVVFSSGQPLAFVYEPTTGTVVQRQLELGLQGQSTYEVRCGLAEGDQVVVHDPAVLADGMSVEVTSAAPDQPKSAEGAN